MADLTKRLIVVVVIAGELVMVAVVIPLHLMIL
jgi:hypothetical protein